MKKIIFLVLIVILLSCGCSLNKKLIVTGLSKQQADTLYCSVGSCISNNTGSSNVSLGNFTFNGTSISNTNNLIYGIFINSSDMYIGYIGGLV